MLQVNKMRQKVQRLPSVTELQCSMAKLPGGWHTQGGRAWKLRAPPLNILSVQLFYLAVSELYPL